MESYGESEASSYEYCKGDNEIGEMDNDTLPSIDNGVLLEGMENTKRDLDDLVGAPLRPNLEENRDFVLVPQEVWDAFCCWYGGGPTVARFVVSKCVHERDQSMTINRVQIYPVPRAYPLNVEIISNILFECNDRN